MNNLQAQKGGICRRAKKTNIRRINLPARSSFFFTAINLLSKGAAFVFTPIFTRLLSPADYGEYSLFSTLLSLSATAVTMEISGGIIMRLYQKEKKRQFLSIISAYLISFTAAIPTTTALFIISRLGGFGAGFPAAYPCLFLSIVSISLINLYVSRCRFLYNWIPPLITSLLQSVAAPIISIILLRADKLSLIDRVSLKVGAITATLTLAAIILTVISVKAAIKEAKSENMKSSDVIFYIKTSVRFILKLALPLLPYYLSVMAIFQTDKLFISSVFGKGTLAGYSIAYSAGTAITAVTGGVMSVFSPWLMRKTRAGEYKKIASTLDKIISSSIPAVLLFLCAAPDFFAFLAPEGYTWAQPSLFISALIPIPLALAQCASSIAIANEKIGGVILSGIIPAAFVFFLDLLLIRRLPIAAIAVITLFGAVLLSTLGIKNVKRITGEYILNVNKTFQNSLFLIFISAFIYVFKDYTTIRIAVAFLSLAAFVIFSRKLVFLLKEKEADSAS